MDMGTTPAGQAKKVSSNSAWDLHTTDLNADETGPDPGKTHYHPNIAGVRRQHDAWIYVNKRETPRTRCFTTSRGVPSSDLKGTSAANHSIWHTIVASIKREQMILNLKRLVPKKAMNNAPSHDYYIARVPGDRECDLELAKKDQRPALQTLRRDRAVEEHVLDQAPHRSTGRLWIIGESRIGKTSWALKQGRHFHIKGEWDPKRFHTNVDYYVLDDVRINQFKYWNDLMQGIEFTYTRKYSKVQLFDSGTQLRQESIPVIWTMNYGPRKRHNANVDVDWLNQNVLFVDLRKLSMKLGAEEQDRLYPSETKTRMTFFDPAHQADGAKPGVHYPPC